MRNYFTPLLALVLLSVCCQSQEALTLKVQCNPETKYINIQEQTSYSEVKYSGSDEFYQVLKDQGVQNPTISSKTSILETVITTGSSTDGTNFPLTMEIVRSTTSDGKKDIPDGLLIYGHGSFGNLPTLDSIVSSGLEEDFKKTLLQTIQSTISQIKIPERQVHVGENFSIETPLSIPIMDISIEMLITTNYKLLSISNGVADFEVSSFYTMSSTRAKYTINSKGSGKGNLLYDISNKFYLKYHMDTVLEMILKIDSVQLDLITKSVITQTSEISRNIGK